MSTTAATDWVKLYQQIADAILPFADKRTELIDSLIRAVEQHGLKPLTLAPTGKPKDIDPFTVIAVFSRLMKDENCTSYAQAVGEALGVSVPQKIRYAGVSRIIANNALFYSWDALEHPEDGDIDRLWDIFTLGISLADAPNKTKEERFIALYNRVVKQSHVKWNLTIGLYWCRPHYFINLDSVNVGFINQHPLATTLKEQLPSLKKLPDGRTYLHICSICRTLTAPPDATWKSLPELSADAWAYAKNKPTKQKGKPQSPDIIEPLLTGSEKKTTGYSKADFLNEVFISEAEYDRIAAALEYKNNLILRGAPGVGKSFAAKRLAYSLMGEKDETRVCMVQFHHSYAYEDFLEGYRPTEKGTLELKHGSFFDFCARAKADQERPYFYIIDEINRGELNKIFGEALLLLEKDKRDEEVTLLYSRKPFTIPANLRIIGMMNTADRSIALMDHALHRRFAFIDMQPAFSHEGFLSFVSKASAPHLRQLLDELQRLNAHIAEDESLGKGFRIGHSYFCPADIGALSDERLTLVLEFEILPLLEEYWFEEPQKLQEWSDRLRQALQ